PAPVRTRAGCTRGRPPARGRDGTAWRSPRRRAPRPPRRPRTATQPRRLRSTAARVAGHPWIHILVKVDVALTLGNGRVASVSARRRLTGKDIVQADQALSLLMPVELTMVVDHSTVTPWIPFRSPGSRQPAWPLWSECERPAGPCW